MASAKGASGTPGRCTTSTFTRPCRVCSRAPASRQSSSLDQGSEVFKVSAVRQPCAYPNWVSTAARPVEAQRLDQGPSQQAQRRRIEQQGPLSGKAQDAGRAIEFEQLMDVEIARAHALSVSI